MSVAVKGGYVFTLHTDTPRPHVHLSICPRGRMVERLNPKKGDLETWRQADRTLGQKVEAFVKAMPAPDSQRLALARELRETGRPTRDRDRER